MIIPYLLVGWLGIWLFFKSVSGRESDYSHPIGRREKLRDVVGWLVCGPFYSFVVGFVAFFVIMAFGSGQFLNIDGHISERARIWNTVAGLTSLTIFSVGSIYSLIRAVKRMMS